MLLPKTSDGQKRIITSIKSKEHIYNPPASTDDFD